MRQVNALFGKGNEPLSLGLLRTTFRSGLVSGSNLFTTELKILAKQNLTLPAFVAALTVEYYSLKADNTLVLDPSHRINYAESDKELAMYTDGANKSRPAPSFYNSSSSSSIRPKSAYSSKEKKDLPCFNFRDTGSCAYGSKCKFSHDSVAPIPPAEAANLVREQLYEAHEVIFFLGQKMKTMRRERRPEKSAKEKRSSSRRTPSLKSKSSRPPTTTTYELAIAKAASAIVEVDDEKDVQDSKDDGSTTNTDDDFDDFASDDRE
jgi:hypothetical protein